MECVKWKNKDYESAVYYFWRPSWRDYTWLEQWTKGERSVDIFYIDGILYSPKFNGESGL